jgi:hypothetical protein
MSEIHKDVVQHPRQRCYFCGSEGPIETHHIVPKRFDGTDSEENLVDLCANCHRRLESLYNKRFYEKMSVLRGAKAEIKYNVDEIKKEVDEFCSSKENKKDIIDWVSNWTNHNEEESQLIVNDMIDKGWLAQTENGVVQVYEIEREKDDISIISPKPENVKGVIEKLERENNYERGVGIGKVYTECKDKLDLQEKEIESQLSKLYNKGEIFNPTDKTILTT